MSIRFRVTHFIATISKHEDGKIDTSNDFQGEDVFFARITDALNYAKGFVMKNRNVGTNVHLSATVSYEEYDNDSAEWIEEKRLYTYNVYNGKTRHYANGKAIREFKKTEPPITFENLFPSFAG